MNPQSYGKKTFTKGIWTYRWELESKYSDPCDPKRIHVHGTAFRYVDGTPRLKLVNLEERCEIGFAIAAEHKLLAAAAQAKELADYREQIDEMRREEMDHEAAVEQYMCASHDDLIAESYGDVEQEGGAL